MDHADDLDLLYYWRVLVRARMHIIAAALAAGILAGLGSRFIMEPIYKASAVILLRDNSSAPAGVPVAAATLFSGLLGQPGSSLRMLAGALLKSRRLSQSVHQQLNLPASYNIGGDRADVSPRQASLKVEQGKEGQISITVAAHTGGLAANIANGYVKALQDYQQSDESSSARRHLRFVETQLSRTKMELESAEETLKSFQQRNKVVAMDASTTQTQQRLWQVDSDLTTTRIALRESQQRLSALRPRLVRRAQSEGAPALANAQEIERLRGKLADVEAELVVERRSCTEEHPRVRELRTNAEAVRAQLHTYMTKSVEAAYEGVMPELIDLEVGAIAGETRLAALQTERDRLRKISEKLPQTALEFGRLSREVKVKSSVYEMLAQEYYRAKMAAAQASLPIVALDSAEIPARPSSPRHKRNIALGLFLGFAMGVMGALVLDWIRSSTVLPQPPSGRERDRAGDGRQELEKSGRR